MGLKRQALLDIKDFVERGRQTRYHPKGSGNYSSPLEGACPFREKEGIKASRSALYCNSVSNTELMGS